MVAMVVCVYGGGGGGGARGGSSLREAEEEAGKPTILAEESSARARPGHATPPAAIRLPHGSRAAARVTVFRTSNSETLKLGRRSETRRPWQQQREERFRAPDAGAGPRRGPRGRLAAH